jgi:hypothetical protein
MLFPLPPTAPEVPPYLRWSLADSIRHDDRETLLVHADVWQTTDGWCWSAKAQGYRPDPDDFDAEELVPRAPRNKGPSAEWASADDAKKAAEAWIREAVAALGVANAR